MFVQELETLLEEFSKSTHGSSDYGNDEYFIKAKKGVEFVPLTYLIKKGSSVKSVHDLLKQGLVYGPYDCVDRPEFLGWYEKQFAKKLTANHSKKIHILYPPDETKVFKTLDEVKALYEFLSEQFILVNNKNLPTQLGEWFAKCIFGLMQIKSTSQRGFDFMLGDLLVEVKVVWGDVISPKGVKIKKSLVELSDSCIIMFVSKDFMIRDICWLDSDFIKRKFSTKGHTLFLKGPDLAPYLFTRSGKHFSKIINKKLFMKFSSPSLALKLEDKVN